MPIFLLSKIKLLGPLMVKYRYLMVMLLMGLLFLSGGYVYYHIENRGYKRGVHDTTLTLTAEIQQLRQSYQDQLDQQTALVVEKELEIINQLNEIKQEHAIEIERVKDEATRAIANHASGVNRLSIQTVSARSTPASAGTTTTCPRSHGTTERRELAPEAVEFLIGEAAYAVAISARLTACQATVRSYLDKTREYNQALSNQK